jgi:hypothetical protein
MCYLTKSPYYSFVAGALLETPNGGQMTTAFSCVLTLCQTTLLLGIVAIHRATEDPFVWRYPGNVVDVQMEADDMLDKLTTLYQAHSKENQVRLANQSQPARTRRQ